jgi:FixJ family two-component response regulator
MVMEALELGARDFVMKPFDTGRLLQAVQKLMS